MPQGPRTAALIGACPRLGGWLAPTPTQLAAAAVGPVATPLLCSGPWVGGARLAARAKGRGGFAKPTTRSCLIYGRDGGGVWAIRAAERLLAGIRGRDQRRQPEQRGASGEDQGHQTLN